jgi:hypothetical protein
MKQDKPFDPLHILRFRTDAVVLDANAITYLIKQLGRCIFISHNKVVINSAMLITSGLTDCLSQIIHRQLNFNVHLKRCLLYVSHLL